MRSITLRMACISLSVALGSLSTYAHADCFDGYKDALRNRTFSEYDWSSLNTIFDNSCSRSGERKQSNIDVGLDVVIEQIPIGLSGSSGSASEKMNAFCRNYSSLRYDASHSAAASDTVVVEALKSLNACVEIEARSGVVVTHKFADPDSLLVNFNFKNPTTKFLVQGVASKNLDCRANGYAEGILVADTQFEANTNFSLLCQRAQVREEDGSTSYSPASLAIATNFDSYAISLPADSIYNSQLASEARQNIASLSSSLSLMGQALSVANQEKSELQTFKDRVGRTVIEQHKVMIGQHNPGGGYTFYGCYTPIEAITNQLCSGAVSSSHLHHRTEGGHKCGYSSYAVTCLRY